MSTLSVLATSRSVMMRRTPMTTAATASPITMPKAYDAGNCSARAAEVDRRARDGRADGDRVDDERRAVVDEALGAERRERAAGQSPGDRGDRRRIGRREDGAEGECDRPGQPERLADPGDDAGGDEHEHDALEQDDAEVAADLAQRGVERLPVEQRRQEQQQHHLGLEFEVGEERDEPDRRAEHEEDERRRHADASGDRTAEHERRTDDDDELETLHRTPPGS